jgi:glycosyltransferase involved in cell wall biosynthesis
MDSDIAVLIDDDEVFEDPGFIGKAREFIGKTINGEFVGAVAGYYLQPDGDWLVECKETAWAKYWDKTDRMNEAFKKIIGEGPRLKETPFVFGGNMIVHRDVFTRIPFDPNVTRGEDIDFLINMKMFGYKFFLDNKLSIKHLPPPKSHPVWKQLREDIRRFAFERAKLRDQNTAPKKMAHVSAEELMPYPGAFLTDDLEEKIAGASSILADHYRFEGKEEDAKEALKNIDIAVESALSKNALEKLIDTQKLWEDIMKFSSTETRKHLTETFTCIKKEEMATL